VTVLMVLLRAFNVWLVIIELPSAQPVFA